MVSIPTVSAFRKLDDAARFALAQQLEASNSAFRAEGVLLGEGRLCQLTHIATGLPFVLVPGGRLGMGLDDAELVAAASRAGGGPMARDCLELLRRDSTPRHDVEIAPFLCAAAPVHRAAADALVGEYADKKFPFWCDGPPTATTVVAFPAAEVPALVVASGLRLVSEAEWEWVARAADRDSWLEGDAERGCQRFTTAPAWSTAAATNGFGMFGLLAGEWVADGWHHGYASAPATGEPWDAPTQPCVHRGGAAQLYPWQDPSEILQGHVAFRAVAEPDATFGVRLALSL